MNLQPYIIYIYICIYIYIKKQSWLKVKATYKAVQKNAACQNNYKIKITHAFLNHLNQIKLGIQSFKWTARKHYRHLQFLIWTAVPTSHWDLYFSPTQNINTGNNPVPSTLRREQVANGRQRATLTNVLLITLLTWHGAETPNFTRN